MKGKMPTVFNMDNLLAPFYDNPDYLPYLPQRDLPIGNGTSPANDTFWLNNTS